MHIESALLLTNELSDTELLINYKPDNYNNKSTNAIKTIHSIDSIETLLSISLLSLDFYTDVSNKRSKLENFLSNIIPQLEQIEISVNNQKSFLIY